MVRTDYKRKGFYEDRFMRRFCWGVFVLLAIPLFWGCGQKLSSKEFGTVVVGIPKVEGADKPFEMPKLGPPPTEEELRHEHMKRK